MRGCPFLPQPYPRKLLFRPGYRSNNWTKGLALHLHFPRVLSLASKISPTVSSASVTSTPSWSKCSHSLNGVSGNQKSSGRRRLNVDEVLRARYPRPWHADLALRNKDSCIIQFWLFSLKSQDTDMWVMGFNDSPTGKIIVLGFLGASGWPCIYHIDSTGGNVLESIKIVIILGNKSKTVVNNWFDWMDEGAGKVSNPRCWTWLILQCTWATEEDRKPETYA